MRRNMIRIARGAAGLGMAGASALALTAVAAPAAHADDQSGCNNQVCIMSRENNTLFEVSINIGVDKSNYHADIFGPPGVNYQGQTEYLSWTTYRAYYRTNHPFNKGDQVCAQGWKETGVAPDGSGRITYASIGLPCITL